MPRRGVRISPAHQATIKAERPIGPVSRAEQSLCPEGNFLASALKAESACAQRGTDFGKGLDIEVILVDRTRTAFVIVRERGLKLSKELQFPTGRQIRQRECRVRHKPCEQITAVVLRAGTVLSISS